jgi:hypothetical protein
MKTIFKLTLVLLAFGFQFSLSAQNTQIDKGDTSKQVSSQKATISNKEVAKNSTNLSNGKENKFQRGATSGPLMEETRTSPLPEKSDKQKPAIPKHKDSAIIPLEIQKIFPDVDLPNNKSYY